jgi:hypothetical protein
VETDPVVVQERAIAAAREFTQRHGFRCYRFNGSRRLISDAHLTAGLWAHVGYPVEFDDASGTMTIRRGGNTPDIVYEGRTSRKRG